MPCEHYKDALIEAAAGGAAPQGDLRAHLASCASCRETFSQEQSLFAAIDAGLHAAANAEVPPSLLPRVRAGLEEVAPAPRLSWLRPMVFASASAILAVVVFLLVRPHHAAPENVATQSPTVVPAPVTPLPEMNRDKPSITSGPASAHAHLSQKAPRSTFLSAVASSNPKVLVPPDEREALAQLVATLNQRKDFAAAFLAQRPEKKDALVTVDRLQISDIEIKALEGTKAEISNGAGEEH